MHALGGRLAGHLRRACLVDLWRWVGSGSPWPDQGACARGVTLVVMELSPFRIERFYAQYEHSTRFMLSSSDCQSRTIAELLGLEPDALERMLECWCGYTESPGAPALRRAIASLYERTGIGEVVSPIPATMIAPSAAWRPAVCGLVRPAAAGQAAGARPPGSGSLLQQ